VTRLYLDFETYSEVDIRAGTHAYAEQAEIMLFAWAIDDGPVHVWDVTSGSDIPADLHEALLFADEIWAHNSQFDRTVMRHAMPELCPPIERWRDTMIQAMAHSLPGALGQLSEVLGLEADQAKDKRGKQLIQLFCKPRPANMKLRRATSETHPEDWATFVEYAAQDIVAMREINRRLPTWNYKDRELDLWHLDQRINDRGVAVDLELATSAMAAVEIAQKELARKTVSMTEGLVSSANKRALLMNYIAEAHGVFMENMQGATVERTLEDPDIPEPVKELLRVRLETSTTSTAKYKSLIKAASSDQRLRGLLQFCGAGRTGRWAGRVWQPQNLPRPSHKEHEIEQGIEAMKAGVLHLVRDDVMAMTSSAIRGCVVAPEGKKLVIADLSNIEGRMLAFLAGEQWKLQAFADFDTVMGKNGEWITGPEWREMVLRGEPPALELDKKGEPVRKGHDLYKLAYAASFGIKPEDVTKDQRQVGKVQELALGYAGGVGAFVTFAAGYGIDLDALAVKILDAADSELVKESTDFLKWIKKQKGETYGLAEDTFIACDVAKRGWRNGHPAIASWWKELEKAFTNAVEEPKSIFLAGTVRMSRTGNWLRIRLPSGRLLCYPSPRLVFGKNEDGEETGTAMLTYMGMDQYTRKWRRITTYSGKLAENITQAAARDCLAWNMPDIEADGYEIVLSVHDELLTETPDDPRFSSDILSAHMATVPPWAEGLPLAAAGFETTRYRKD
jgi:DNA polymerase bacteriophage-type